MKSTDGCRYRSGADELPGKLQDVDDARVPATSQQYEAARSIEDESQVLGNVVFHPALIGCDFDSRRVMLLRKNARHRSRQPHAGEDLFRFVMFDKHTAGGFVLFLS